MTVAMMPATFPAPKNNITGIKYTKLGMVCITSSIGFMRDSTKVLREASTPIGIPMKVQRNTDTRTKLRVSNARPHNPMAPMNNKLAADKTETA